MNPLSLGFTLAAALAAIPAHAGDEFHSPPAEASLEAASRYAAAAARGRDMLLKARPTDAEVGDADSFGREVRWLGLMAGSVFLQPNCSAGDASCVALNPAPAPTSFDVPDIAVVTLPGGSSQSLLIGIASATDGSLSYFVQPGAYREWVDATMAASGQRALWNVSAVPEPSPAWLLCAGLTVLAWRRRLV